MANDGSLVFDTRIDTKGFNTGIKALGKAAAALGKAAAAGVAAAGTAFVALGTKVVGAYGRYESLVAGIDTLFGESSAQLQQYAENAYKTAGLSANAYMEQATSFAASLSQSLGGDMAKAADYADMAIVDMTRNASKMGTSVESIQNAYQGFAKQNYTMLDNLKLGYGGTLSEMERLIADANKLREEQGLNADLTIDSYADIVDAIHTVQTEMGISGTTSEEAASTIKGSIGMMKGAWENFIVGLGNSDADMEKLADNLAESFTTVAENIMPVLDNMGKAIAKVAPKLVQSGGEIITNLANGILQMLPEITPIIVEVVTAIVQLLADNAELLITAGTDILMALALGLIHAIPTLITQIPQIIIAIVSALLEALPEIADAGMQLIDALWEGMVALWDDIVLPWITDLWNAIVSAISGWFQSLVSAGQEIITGIWNGMVMRWTMAINWVKNLWSDIVAAIEGWYQDLLNSGKKVISAIWDGLKQKWEEVKQWFSNAWNGLIGNLSANINVNASAGAGGAQSNGKFATGLDYVPFDGFTATLHKGEMVVPAYDAATLRAAKGVSGYYTDSYKPMSSGSRAGDVNVTQNIYAQKQSPAAILKEAIWRQERAVMIGV